MSGVELDGIDGPFNACCYRETCIATQATVDTLRAQLEAAEARAEAAEADAARWRTWRALDEHAASDIAWAYDAMGRDTAIDAAIARTKEETSHAGEA